MNNMKYNDNNDGSYVYLNKASVRVIKGLKESNYREPSQKM